MHWRKNMVLLIDTNIIIDVLQERNSFLENSSKIVELIKNKKCRGYLASHSIPNIWYVLRKTHTDEQRRKLILSLISIFKIVSLNKNKIIKALKRNDFQDFEDCLQDECAAEVKADYVITRNPKDFCNSLIPVLSPEEFLKRAEY